MVSCETLSFFFLFFFCFCSFPLTMGMHANNAIYVCLWQLMKTALKPESGGITRVPCLVFQMIYDGKYRGFICCPTLSTQDRNQNGLKSESTTALPFSACLIIPGSRQSHQSARHIQHVVGSNIVHWRSWMMCWCGWDQHSLMRIWLFSSSSSLGALTLVVDDSGLVALGPDRAPRLRLTGS